MAFKYFEFEYLNCQFFSTVELVYHGSIFFLLRGIILMIGIQLLMTVIHKYKSHTVVP